MINNVINEEESLKYIGGASKITAALVSALSKTISILYEIGQNLGSSIRRYINKTSC